MTTVELTDEQQFIRETAGQWFAANDGTERARTLLEGKDPGPYPWDELVELAFLSALAGESVGGPGLSLGDLAIIANEAGRALSSAPVVSTGGRVVPLLSGLDEAGAELLAGVVNGSERLAVVDVGGPLASASGAPEHDGGGLAVEDLGAELVLRGISRPILDALGARSFIVVWRGAEIVVAHLAEGEAELLPSKPVDATRGLGRLRLDGARATVLARGAAAADAVLRSDATALTVLAAESAGSSTVALDLTLEYARDRFAFGRAIGSFQAVKHACVDSWTAIEQLRGLVLYAAWAADEAPERFPVIAHAAKAHASETGERVTASCIQIHGGIGFTWEHDAHLFWRRAKVDALLFGRPDRHYRAVARAELERMNVSRTDDVSHRGD